MAVSAKTNKTDKPAQNSRMQQAAASYTGGAIAAQRLPQDIDRIIRTALEEDLGLTLEEESRAAQQLISADITTCSTIPADKTATATMIAKTTGTVAGLEIAARVFRLLDPSIRYERLVEEGCDIAKPPVVLARFSGSARAILVAERTALNLIQRMSGIATVARTFSKKAAANGTIIVDTRKTTPGLRSLEKYAVTVGGACNHRYGLFDAILIKDNHITVSGGVAEAITQARTAQPGKPVEIEVSNMEELDEALASAAEKIMLDNMTPSQIALCAQRVSGRSIIEVSGGINADNLASYLVPGVDAISIGALTHSVRSMDISLEIEV